MESNSIPHRHLPLLLVPYPKSSPQSSPWGVIFFWGRSSKTALVKGMEKLVNVFQQSLWAVCSESA